MTHYSLDSSAVVKRYLPEIGTARVRRPCDPAPGNTIALSELTVVEVAAALAARHARPAVSRPGRATTR